jgi:lipopolysaccharide heptosyltransferase II
MTTPAFRALKENHPRRKLTLLCSSAGAVVNNLIDVDDVIVYDAPWVKATQERLDSQPDLNMVELIKQRKFDGAIIFTVFSQNPLPAALLTFLADIPLRLAYCRENPYQLLTHWVLDPEPSSFIRHEVRRQLDLVESVGCFTENEQLALRLPEEIREKVSSRLEAQGIDIKEPFIIIHPGASAPSRRYPPEHFAKAADHLLQTLNCQLIFTGVEAERGLIEGIQSKIRTPSYSFVGTLDFLELCALISLAKVLIVNNTGPAHIAAALGTPVVDLYALTNPQHTPWKVSNRVLSYDVPCKFCYKSVCPEGHNDCLRKVTPESVVEAACELFYESEENV